MKVGLLFGSFNPIHNGHLIIANLTKQQTDLEQIWFIVSPQNPHKINIDLLNVEDRIHMVQVATGDNPDFRAEDIELKLSIPSFTIRTLNALLETYPECDFSLIIGADNLKTLHSWKDSALIVEKYRIFVYPRLGYDDTLKLTKLAHHYNVHILKNIPLMEISSTFIRKMISNGINPKYLIPDSVAKIIYDNGFYV